MLDRLVPIGVSPANDRASAINILAKPRIGHSRQSFTHLVVLDFLWGF